MSFTNQERKNDKKKPNEIKSSQIDPCNSKDSSAYLHRAVAKVKKELGILLIEEKQSIYPAPKEEMLKLDGVWTLILKIFPLSALRSLTCYHSLAVMRTHSLCILSVNPLLFPNNFPQVLPGPSSGWAGAAPTGRGQRRSSSLDICA